MGGVAYKMVKKAHYECDLGPGGRGDSLKMKQSRLSFLKTTPKKRGGGVMTTFLKRAVLLMKI